LRVCSHSRHIPTAQGMTQNSKYLIFHKGANKARIRAQLQTLKYTYQPFFLFESLLQEVLANGQFLEFFIYFYPIY
jgi:hypothetical protein